MVLGVLAVLWVLVGPIVALANAVGAKRNVRVLLRRIETLEAQLVGSAPPARQGPWGVPPAEPVASPIPESALARDVVRPSRKRSARDLRRKTASAEPLRTRGASGAEVAGAAAPKRFPRNRRRRRSAPPGRIAGIENRRALDRAGRRAGAGARRDLPRPLLDRGGADRSRRADRRRLPARRGALRRRASGCAAATARSIFPSSPRPTCPRS